MNAITLAEKSALAAKFEVLSARVAGPGGTWKKADNKSCVLWDSADLLTHIHTYVLTHLLTHLLTYSLTHSLTYSLTHLGVLWDRAGLEQRRRVLTEMTAEQVSLAPSAHPHHFD